MGSVPVGHGNQWDGFGLRRRGFCGASLGACLPAFAGAELPTVQLALSEAVDPQFVASVLTTLEPPAKLRWQQTPVPFSRLLYLVEQGAAIGFGVSPTVSRSERMTFTRAAFTGAVWAVTRQDGRPAVRGVEHLRGHVVCTSPTAFYGLDFTDPVFEGIEVQTVQGDLPRRLQTLLAGRCDVLLVTTANARAESLQARIQRAGGDVRMFSISKHPLAEQGVHFAAAKAGPMAAWIPRIDAAIQAQRPRIQQLAAIAS